MDWREMQSVYGKLAEPVRISATAFVWAGRPSYHTTSSVQGSEGDIEIDETMKEMEEITRKLAKWASASRHKSLNTNTKPICNVLISPSKKKPESEARSNLATVDPPSAPSQSRRAAVR